MTKGRPEKIYNLLIMSYIHSSVYPYIQLFTHHVYDLYEVLSIYKQEQSV